MSKIISTFVPAMKLDLYINEANDYARDIRVPVLHPHVAIIHYDEAPNAKPRDATKVKFIK